MIKSGDKCECGGTLKTPEELGLNPESVVNDQGWAWKLKQALICDKCGGHYLFGENRGCELCDDTGEIIERPIRLIGYTLAPGEDIDEHFVKCPACNAKDGQE